MRLADQFQDQRSGSPGPLMHRAPYFPNGKAYEIQTWYTDRGRQPASATGAMTSKVNVKVARSRDQPEPCWPSRKRIVIVSPKLAGGYKCCIAHQFQGPKVRVTGRLTQSHKMCHILRTVKPKNFKVGVRLEDV